MTRIKRFLANVFSVLRTDGRDLFEKARRVATYTFGVTFTVPAVSDFGNANAWKSAVYAAGVAVASAVWNTIKNYRYERIAEEIQAAWVSSNQPL